MSHKIIISSILAIWISIIFFGKAAGEPLGNHEITQERLEVFAKCLTSKGWVMYSSFTCPACRAQQKLFGKTSAHLKIIECNPHAPDTQVDLCLKKKIRYTPTWLMEKNGVEIKRVKGYKKLDDLASITECTL